MGDRPYKEKFLEDKHPNIEPEELWEPQKASYYNGELILQPEQWWTQQQQLELIDWHPMFNGKCPLVQSRV